MEKVLLKKKGLTEVNKYNVVVLRSFDNEFESKYTDLLYQADIKHKVNLNSIWLKTYIKSYIANNELFIICVNKGSKLIGCLPMFMDAVRATRFWNHRTLKIIGNGPTDFFDIVSLKNTENIVAQCIIKFLLTNNEWDKFELTQISRNSHYLKLLEENLSNNRNLNYTIDFPNGYYFVNTSKKSWYDYEREFKEKNKDLAKSERRLIKDNIRLEIKTHRFEIYSKLLDNLNLYEERRRSLGQINTYETQERNAFLNNLISKWEKSDRVELNQLLDSEGNIWAFQLDWIDNKIRYHWNHAYNESFKRYSPGKYLLKEIMKSSFSNADIDECNFMRGLSDYKSKLVDEKEMFSRIMVDNPKSIRLKATKMVSNFFKILRK